MWPGQHVVQLAGLRLGHVELQALGESLRRRVQLPPSRLLLWRAVLVEKELPLQAIGR